MIDRRGFLRFSLAAGAAGLVPRSLLGRQEPRKARAAILLWMGGGPSQTDTWDPKPDSANGGGLQAMDTVVPGIRISELLPVCASQMKHLSILRSVVTRESAHERAEKIMQSFVPLTCFEEDPALGSVVSYELGRKGSALPRFVAIDAPQIPETTVFPDEDLPVYVQGGEDAAARLSRTEDSPREQDRKALLAEQTGEWEAKRKQKEVARLRETVKKADDVLHSPFVRAFDLQQEPEELRKAYGGRFGQDCLIARRLVEAGCAFVEIGLHGWDAHADAVGRARKLCGELDPGLGTLVRDLADRGLLRDTVVVCCGEFGRSPALNEARGRDHWTKGFSVVLAGGALAGGRVYGETGLSGTEVTNPVPHHDLSATVYKAIGIDFNKKYEQLGRKVKYASPIGNAMGTVRPVMGLF